MISRINGWKNAGKNLMTTSVRGELVRNLIVFLKNENIIKFDSFTKKERKIIKKIST